MARLTSSFTSAIQNYQIGGAVILQLSANDYIEVWFFGSGNSGVTGQTATWFSGFLVSAT